MMKKLSKHKKGIRNMVLTVVCYLGFRILSFSRDTSCIVAVIFLVSAEFMIPILEIVEELRDLEEKTQ